MSFLQGLESFIYVLWLCFIFLPFHVLFVLLQPGLAEGEEVINEDVIKLKEGLHKRVAWIQIMLFCCLYNLNDLRKL